MVKDVLKQKVSCFLFVPHVRYIEEISSLLKSLHNKVEGVHAEDPMRKEKSQRSEREKSHY